MKTIELSIKEEIDFQNRMQKKIELWDYVHAQPLLEEASKLIDDSDQIRSLYNRNIEPFNIAEEKND